MAGFFVVALAMAGSLDLLTTAGLHDGLSWPPVLLSVAVAFAAGVAGASFDLPDAVHALAVCCGAIGGVGVASIGGG